MSPRKQVGKGLSELPIDDFVVDEKPEDEGAVPTIESPPLTVENEPAELPVQSEQPAFPSESEDPVIPSKSEPSPDTDGLVTETKAIALENPPTAVVTPSPSVTMANPENEPVPEKVVKKKAVATILERKEPEESGGNRIPKSGDLVHEHEVRENATVKKG